MSIQTGLAIVAACFLAFIAASEFHEYNKRRTLCNDIQNLAIAFNRDLAPNHKCRPYL